MNARTSLFTSLAIAASLGLAGCGGSSNNNDDDSGAPPKSYDVTLGDGHGLGEGPTTLTAGATTTEGGTTLTCTPDEGSTGCMLTVEKNPVLGTYEATSTGGMVTVTPPSPPKQMVTLPLPDGHNIRDRLDQDDENQTDRFRDGKYLDIKAGGNINYGGVRFACPAGGDNCRVTFTTGLNNDSVEATTGGEGNGTATAILLSTEAVGTGVGLATLREEITKGPAASPSALSRRLGYPEADTQRNANTPFRSGHMTTPESTGHAAATAPSGDKAWHGGPWRGISWEPASNEISVRFDNQDPLMTFAEKYGLNRGNANDVSITEGRLFGTGISNDPEAQRVDFWNLLRATEDTGRAGAGPVSIATAQGTGVDDYRIPATFDGVPGTLICATDCGTITSERITEGGAQVGKLRGPTTGTGINNWTFTATSSTATVAGLGDREDYLAFGWWRKDDSAGGRFSEFEPVYGGRIPFGYVPDNKILKGKATYVGGAAGNYTDYSGRGAPATNPAASGDDPADRPDRHGGWFVADAELTANFNFNVASSGTDADAEPDNISGTIKNFRGQHGSLGTWQVKLDSTGLTVTPDTISPEGTPVPVVIATPSPDMNTSGNADGENWKGRWGGSFFGESAEDHSRLPSGVAGWFHAATGTEYVNSSGGVEVRYDGAVGVAVQGSFAAPRKP